MNLPPLPKKEVVRATRAPRTVSRWEPPGGFWAKAERAASMDFPPDVRLMMESAIRSAIVRRTLINDIPIGTEIAGSLRPVVAAMCQLHEKMRMLSPDARATWESASRALDGPAVDTYVELEIGLYRAWSALTHALHDSATWAGKRRRGPETADLAVFVEDLAPLFELAGGRATLSNPTSSGGETTGAFVAFMQVINGALPKELRSEWRSVGNSVNRWYKGK